MTGAAVPDEGVRRVRGPDLPAGPGTGLRRALVYARTGPDGSGPAVELQLAAAAAHARLGGFEPAGDAVDEGVSGGLQPFSRPGLGSALAALSAGEAEALAVSAIDRISGDASVAAVLLDCARLDGWKLLVPGIADCSTSAGHFAVTVLCALTRLVGVPDPGTASVHQSEFQAPAPAFAPTRRRHSVPPPLPAAPSPESVGRHPGSYLDAWIRAIGESAAGIPADRIARSLNDARTPLPVGLIAGGHVQWTQQSVSRLVEWPQGADLLGRALAEREQGRMLEQIAHGLNEDGMPTRRGGTWSAASVTALLDGDPAD